MGAIKLTALASCAGCAAKLGSRDLMNVLRPLSGFFPAVDYPALLVGLEEPDDAAVYQVDENRAIISTVDFFPPVMDDPYAFGMIAAANALSDVYAMGGRPLLAINLVAFPDTLDLSILSDILRGGAEKVREAGAVVAGGHTIIDNEPKYGLAVTGEVHPQRILKKSGAQPGDTLILTKPLGTGTITTALKRGLANPEHVDAAITGMGHLNRTASEIAQQFPVHAMTDITGYSLIGHGCEMAGLSRVTLQIRFSALPWYPGALDYGAADIFPGGMTRNRDYFSQRVRLDNSLTDWQRKLLFDPQTSGGLLMAVEGSQDESLLETLLNAGEAAAIIGKAVSGDGGIQVIA